MAMTFTSDSLRQLFQSAFHLTEWREYLQHFFGATALREQAEVIEGSETEKGFYLGKIDTSDSYSIGLFHYQVSKGSVVNKRVGLRHLVKSFINPTWGEFDAALVVFDDGKHWRLSFICDIKGENTVPKRYTFVFGESDNYYNTAVNRFVTLKQKGISFETLKDAFSVEALSKDFYKDLFEWYQWAVDPSTNITFPNNTSTEDDDRDDIETKIIRMITRIMFVWFIKQKQLVPDCIFELKHLKKILKDFDPLSTTVGNYYNAILQNLFFGTLNRAIIEEDGSTRKFSTSSKRDVKTLYRYAEMFAISEQEVIDTFAEIPFLNGGLFECLDKTRYIDGVEQCYNFDGFSRNDARFADGRFKHRAVVPNILFFEPERGLLSILSRYNFTIEENSPEEQQVALDPELLGKVFENLLGAYNPETQETARNQSGSFYTPREIVNFMVDESLIAYLGKTELVRSLFGHDFQFDASKTEQYKEIADKLKAIKILDPACGSGAFPMGILNRMVEIFERIQPDANVYELKLSIIENCLYGSDIQSIAAQITKLRFFISLICNCEKDASAINFGIPTLPNLETKFVSANTLIAKKKKDAQLQLFENPDIETTNSELAEIRHKHFAAKSASTKHRLRKQDQELREKLANLLSEDNCFAPEDAKQLSEWNPYDQNAVSSFFDPEWMFGVSDGFDLVIGNPPYIQLQSNGGKLGKLYEKSGYCSFVRTADLYCLFYERGWQLLKCDGHLCFITSNKWMRAGYGANLREFFAKKTNPLLLIDFAGVKVFENATVDANILMYAKSENEQKTICAVANKQNKDCIKNLSDFIQQQSVECSFDTSDSWVVLSPIEQSIKRKIEAVGTPLKEWDIQIYRGVLTGCNDAFIIDTAKRNEILSNCQTEEERQRTDELIRPILRGKDIKRYGYEWADLWLIYIPWHFPYQFDASIQGASDKAEKAFKEQYPAVYSHMLQYKEPLSKRNKAETGIRYEWYAMQRWGAKYWEDFSKPKIIWKRIGSILRFSYDNKGCLGLDSTCFATGRSIEYLCCVLNSLMGHYLLKDSPKTGTGDLLVSVQAIEPIKIPSKLDYETRLSNLLNKQIACWSTEVEEEINDIVFSMYGLSTPEREYITLYVTQSQQSL